MNVFLKLSVIAIVLLGSGLIESCLSNSKSAVINETVLRKTDEICNPVLKTNKLPDSIKSDFFEIESMILDGHCLKLGISYGGGCGETSLQLFYENIDASTMPANVFLSPKFTDHDPCRAIVHDSVLFDLSEFQGVARSGGVIIHLVGYKEKVVFALPLH